MSIASVKSYIIYIYFDFLDIIKYLCNIAFKYSNAILLFPYLSCCIWNAFNSHKTVF